MYSDPCYNGKEDFIQDFTIREKDQAQLLI